MGSRSRKIFHGDAYCTLGVLRDATDAEIRKAWKAKMLALHPDRDRAAGRPKSGAAKREAEAKRVNEAWASLKNSEARANYDAWYPKAGTPAWDEREADPYASRRQTPKRPSAESRPSGNGTGPTTEPGTDNRQNRRERTRRGSYGPNWDPTYTGEGRTGEPRDDPRNWRPRNAEGRADHEASDEDYNRSGSARPGERNGRRRQRQAGAQAWTPESGHPKPRAEARMIFRMIPLMLWLLVWTGCGTIALKALGIFAAQGPGGLLKIPLDIIISYLN